MTPSSINEYITTKNFAEFNVLDSAKLDDVKLLTTNENIYHGIKKNESVTVDYTCLSEMREAANWPYEHFTYTLNYHGFRMPVTPEEIDIGVFGCSFTFGTGMPVSGLWHTILGERLKQSIGNFGIAGISATSALDIFLIVSKHVRMKKAIFLLPSFNRYQVAVKNEEISNIQYMNTIPNNPSRLCESFGLLTEQVYKALPDEQFYKDVRNKLYITDMIAKNRNIDTYVTTWEHNSYEFMEHMKFNHIKLLPEWNHPPEIIDDKARDGMHPGFNLNLFFAELITPHIK